MQRPAVNLAAGFLASGVGTLAALAVVPLYLRHLGAEGYGIVAFFLTLQGLLQVFDLGLTATANRRVAQAVALDGVAAAGPLLNALGWVTWAVAAVLTLLLLAAAVPLANGWLRLQELPSAQVTAALLLMALALGVRWPAGLYQNMLLGADRLDRWSVISSIVTVVAHGGAALLLWGADGGLRTFFAWHLLAGILLVAWSRAAARRTVRVADRGWPDLRELRSVREFSLGMTGIGVTALALMHLDKLLLSRLLPLDAFGHYMLAWLVAGGFYAAVMPVFNWAYPRLTLLGARDPGALASTYALVSHALACILLPLAMFFALSAEGLLSLWLRDPAVAARVAPLMAMLAAGSALHCMMFMPYALTLARGAASLALRINIALLVLLAPMLAALTWAFGALGAAGAWLLLHIGYLLFGSIYTHTRLLPAVTRSWLLRDVGPGLLVAVALGVPGWLLANGPLAPMAPLQQVAWGGGLCVLGWAVLLIVPGRLRRLARHRFVESPT